MDACVSANPAVFQVGDVVRERDTEIIGRIAQKGAFADEWLLALADGTAVICLGENLVVVAEAAAG
jgi:hypothetical protein